MLTFRVNDVEVSLEKREGIWDFKTYDFGTEYHEGTHYSGCRWSERTIYLGPLVLAFTRLIQ